MELTYDEIVDVLDVKGIAGSTIGYTLPPGCQESSGIILIVKFILPNAIKVNSIINVIR